MYDELSHGSSLVSRRLLVGWIGMLLALGSLLGCGDDEPPVEGCQLELTFPVGTDGHTDPLGSVGPGAARAGRLSSDALPSLSSGLAVWAPGDFVIANDRIAMIIEDVGPSDLYDPWGGRPVGLTRVADGQLIEPAEFGEFFILTGRQTVVTTSVSVIADGTDGGPAIVRTSGMQAPLPFYEALIGTLLRDDYSDIPTAIDYVLQPDAEYIDIYVLYNSPREADTRVGVVLHGFMYTDRMPTYAPGLGFETEGQRLERIAFIDEDATSYSYVVPGEDLGVGISASGFASNFGDAFDLAACAQTERHYARITVGGPGLDGLEQTIARTQGNTLRELTGTVVYDDGTLLADVRVHATDTTGNYLTRTLSDDSGVFRLHVPETVALDDIQLFAFRRGDEVLGPVLLDGQATDIALTMETTGTIEIATIDDDTMTPLPVRIQVLPVGRSVPSVPGNFGEPEITGGRLHVEYAMDGQANLRAPPGQWEVIVSRGYEYEIHREVVDVFAGQTVEVAPRLAHSVDTTGYMCADFHIHTHRSPDSGDDAREKLRSGIADGVDIPVRTEHEFVDDFQPLIEELGLEAWAYGVGSIEMTSFQVWGHMGVFPLMPDPAAVNGGAPLWQRYPSAAEPDRAIETLLPPEVFAQVRARPERPAIIINHPRGNVNYFSVAGYDNVTGEVASPEYWDEEFDLVEVFNSSSWQQQRDDIVADWLSFLNQGRRVFAVGSSDTHGIAGKPIGYPRTCLQLGTDDPQALTPVMVRDATQSGHSTISGGIYVYASVEGGGPGDDVIGVPQNTMVDIRVEAPSWIAVDWIEVVVDGQTVHTVGVLPGDADPGNLAIRYRGQLDVQVDAGLGSYVIVAAYGDSTLDPVHPGRRPFGATNPIFLMQ